MKLTNWRARRAGGRITITGINEAGQTAKIVGVDVIEPGTINGTSAHVIAVDKSGATHRLEI